MIKAEELRVLALSLPEATEKETWREATFRVRDMIFLTLAPDGSGAGVKASLDDQDWLIRHHSDAFAMADYTGRYGWVSARLDVVDAHIMRDLVIKAWRRAAPKRVIAAYDALRHRSEAELRDGEGATQHASRDEEPTD